MSVVTNFKVLVVLTFVILNQVSAMVLQKNIDMLGGDELVIGYSGSDFIYVLTSELPDVFEVISVNKSLSNVYGGSIYVRLRGGGAAGDYRYILLFYSLRPFNVNITLVRGREGYLIDVLNCPANITLQLLLTLVVNGTRQDVRGPAIPTPPTLPGTPPWGLVVMGIALAMFVAAGILDIKDYSVIKRGRWGKQESIALMVRYLLYSSITALALSLITAIAYSIYINLIYGAVVFNLSWFLTPITFLAITSIIYLICKWRGWYDVVDERE